MTIGADICKYIEVPLRLNNPCHSQVRYMVHLVIKCLILIVIKCGM